MADRRRNVQQQTSPPKLQRLEEFDDTCDFFASQTFITPAFSDPRRVLLRRVFFLNEDRTKHVSVGFYPTRDYKPQVEFGAVKRNKTTVLILVNQHVATLAAILPTLCESMCTGEPYVHKDGDFKLTASKGGNSARMYLHDEYISFKLVELRHLSFMFHVVQKQLDSYTNAMADVLTYATAALSSSVYIEPAPGASKHVAYPQLFEELKTIL